MNIFLLGATPQIRTEPDQDPIFKLAKTGGNTGNQIIAHALLGQIDYHDISWDYRTDPHEVNEHFDMFVIAAANFLFPSFDFGGMADYIERTALPVTIVGLGAQAPAYDPDIKLLPGTERFLKVVAERAVSIGVRGPFTQQVLYQRGIHNVTTTGCPSYYMRGESGVDLTKQDFNRVRKISINASRDVIEHAFAPIKMREIVREIYRVGIAWDADFIAQSEEAEIRLADHAPQEYTNSALADICGFLRGVDDDAKVREWVGGHLRVFFHVVDWINAIRGYDFVFGTRFHGNMLALQHGVPACVVCHDTRTEEMCQFLAMPFVNIVDLATIHLQELYDIVDTAAWNQRYKILYPQYIEFLRANNLSTKICLAA